MSSIGTGYDLSAQTYSPDGRVFQVEYAAKAVENSGTALGARCKDGVVFAVEKLVPSKMLVPGTSRRVHAVDASIGCAYAGLQSDGDQLVAHARSEARGYKTFYGHAVPVKALNERMAQYVQKNTTYGWVRPFGAAMILGGMDHHGPQLFMIDVSGTSFGYYACALGKGKQQACSELEKYKFDTMSAEEAAKTLTKIIYMIHDEVKDKEFELELAWVTEATGRRHQLVSEDFRQAAIAYAKTELRDLFGESSDSDDD